MRRLCFFLILLLVGPVSGIAIVEFCPDPFLSGDPDEYVVLEGTGSLDGIVVSDGEGGFRFPAGSDISGRLVVARNSAAYLETHGMYPDFEVYDYSPIVPDVVRSGTFQLSNSGDQLMLYENSRLVQEVVWPRDVTARQGQVHFYEGGSWDPRVLMLGQSRFTPAVFTEVDGVAFTAPDCSLEIFEDAVEAAEVSILVNVYEFTSPRMARDLIDARARGVEVRVLLEGGPVGGISDEEQEVIRLLREGGVPVSIMISNEQVHAPYRFDHAKFMVIDTDIVVVTSENFKENGFPEPGTSGNRGWGVALEDPRVAGYFRDVFSYDINGRWAVPATGEPGSCESWARPSYGVEFLPIRFSNATVIPVIAPDTSRLVEDLIDQASESIDIEQAYITNQSDGSLNPFLARAVEAARNGVRVRVLLDSYYYNTDGDEDNDELVAVLNALARREGIPLEARCADLAGNNIEKIHNKGVIVDRRKVLVSSINWNTNSPTFNREAGVIVDHPDVGEYYSRVFEDDWEAGGAGRRAGPDLQKVGIATVTVGLLVLVWAWRRRTVWRR
ncbi:MAG TPA: phospholipase D-like domain-containing protein [Methanoregulaceae archaeon]|nr:MAG: phospholipase [Methanolinea sp.]HON81575.1 phospholipase D-like domain-containing protein [Methanoregulaceae archaeon]HPD10382.1 phospholipase D-like domain-containing protein [Methanoregulaceae archaeon]HRT15324.1 phospholipase D-like domain-containing protein [Methanoregulaceae archaeon]HRU30974.1 phospholipase D-like domain-containing protein [Methanoregulaceae archaeon]